MSHSRIYRITYTPCSIRHNEDTHIRAWAPLYRTETNSSACGSLRLKKCDQFYSPNPDLHLNVQNTMIISMIGVIFSIHSGTTSLRSRRVIRLRIKAKVFGSMLFAILGSSAIRTREAPRGNIFAYTKVCRSCAFAIMTQCAL